MPHSENGWPGFAQSHANKEAAGNACLRRGYVTWHSQIADRQIPHVQVQPLLTAPLAIRLARQKGGPQSTLLFSLRLVYLLAVAASIVAGADISGPAKKDVGAPVFRSPAANQIEDSTNTESVVEGRRTKDRVGADSFRPCQVPGKPD